MSARHKADIFFLSLLYFWCIKMSRMLFTFGIITSIIVLADTYFFFAIRSLIAGSSNYNLYKWLYIGSSVVILSIFSGGYFMYLNGIHVAGAIRVTLQGIVFCLFVPKVLAIGIFAIDDLLRFFRWIFNYFSNSESSSGAEGISRLKFLQYTGLGVFGFFFSAFLYGIVRGAYDISVKRIPLKIKGLPKALEGTTILQISDLHVGSFYSTNPLEEAVKIINQQAADFVFFTGDLVNEIAEEAEDFVPILNKIEAKQGKFSILGNHDYGDYYYHKEDPSFVQQKLHNKELMKQHHQNAGFRLLLDEHVQFELDGAKMAFIGIENWGAKGRFPKYGKLDRAYRGSEECDLKLLLSHDPSHWDAQVRTEYPDIDVTFSGHTHGMQFGIEIPGIKWSPVKYMYHQWAGLYKEGEQQLYVNRGLGFIGYPGRVGILPEITVLELRSA